MTQLQVLTSHLSVLAVVGALYATWLLFNFSRRMTEVTRMAEHYRWFIVGEVFLGVALLGYVLLSNAALVHGPPFLLSPLFALLAFHLPLALGVGISLVVTLIYWGWLVRKL